MVRAFWRLVALMVVVSTSSTAYAHEFIAKPAAMTVQAGAELQVAGLCSRVFLTSQELEAPKDVKVGFYADGTHCRSQKLRLSTPPNTTRAAA